MKNETINQFIERTLYELAEQPEFRMPKALIPQLSHLIENYPNLEANGTRTALTNDLEMLIENIRKQGALD